MAWLKERLRPREVRVTSPEERREASERSERVNLRLLDIELGLYQQAPRERPDGNR